MMLDVLFKIKDEQDPTLAFRRSCRFASFMPLSTLYYILGNAGFLLVSLALMLWSNIKACVRVIQGGHLRLMCNEHKWNKLSCLPYKGRPRYEMVQLPFIDVNGHTTLGISTPR